MYRCEVSARGVTAPPSISPSSSSRTVYVGTGGGAATSATGSASIRPTRSIKSEARFCVPPPIGPQQVVPDYQFRAPIDPALLPDLIRLEAARDAAKDAREAYRLTAPLDADGYRTAAADAELDRLEVAEIAADNAFYALSEPSRTPRVHQKMSMNW